MEIYDIAIVGGGVSGLSLAWHLIQKRPDLQVVVMDKGSKPGGCIRTLERSGFRVELGANGVVDRDPSTLDLVRALGLEDELIRCDVSGQRRYLYLDGQLVVLPDNPRALMRSSLLPLNSRLRMLCEPLIPRAAIEAELSVAAFVRRRLGRRVAERILDPFVSGVYAGDPEKLSMRAAFPQIHQMEQKFGSLVRGAMKMRKARGEDKDAVGTLWSLKGGMGVLSLGLAEALGPKRLQTNTTVTELERFGPGWRLHVAGPGPALLARNVVMSTPAPVAGDLLDLHCQDLGDLLKKWPYAGVVVVALAYKREQVEHPLDGFGYLVPSLEQRSILGCLFSSTVFPEARAPAGHVLLRVIMGGVRNPSMVDFDAKKLIRIAAGEVGGVLGIQGEPVMSQAIRWANAIPQYEIGHGTRVEKVTKLTQKFCPGIRLHSNAYHGVAVNDCCRNSLKLASELASTLPRN